MCPFLASMASNHIDMFYVYIIQSLIDRSFYIGFSNNPFRRIMQHNHANTGYTATKKPWVIIYCEKHASKTNAIKREKQLKNCKNTKVYKKLAQQYANRNA